MYHLLCACVPLFASVYLCRYVHQYTNVIERKLDSSCLRIANLCDNIVKQEHNETSYSLVSYAPKVVPKYYYNVCITDVLIRAIEYDVLLFMRHVHMINEQVNIFSQHELDALYSDICMYGYSSMDSLVYEYLLKHFKYNNEISARIRGTLKDLFDIIKVENTLITNYVRQKVKIWLKFHESIVIAARLNKQEITNLINKMTVSIQVMKIIYRMSDL